VVRRPPGRVESAEVAVDAAEAHAARIQDSHRRAHALAVARLLRRIDQAVVGFANDIDYQDEPARQPQRLQA
jgi:hypothetical protein